MHYGSGVLYSLDRNHFLQGRLDSGLYEVLTQSKKQLENDKCDYVIYDHGVGKGLQPNWHGFVWHRTHSRMEFSISDGYRVGFPLWLPLMPLMLLLVWQARKCVKALREYAAIQQGLCPTCRYDLRMHKSGDRCPECGRVIAAK